MHASFPAIHRLVYKTCYFSVPKFYLSVIPLRQCDDYARGKVRSKYFLICVMSYSVNNALCFTGFLNEECDDTIIELSKLSIADQTHEVTVLDTFHDTSSRIATARDYVLRRCNQTDAILFDECYPDT